MKRFLAIWFRHLHTDWFTTRRPELASVPFIIASPDHGRMIVTAANNLAEKAGIHPGMVVADARAFIPKLEVLDEQPGLSEKLLQRIAEWCICFSPVVAVDLPDGLLLDITGCAHLWGGESNYLAEINKRFKTRGYQVRIAMADTIGGSWAMARYGKTSIAHPGMHIQELLTLPPASLRLEIDVVERLNKLGLRQVRDFLTIARPSLRRRFGPQLNLRLMQATGEVEELIEGVSTPVPFQERLPCLEPIVTARGIEIALERLLDSLCQRMIEEGKGLRTGRLTCFRVDDEILSLEISTTRPSHNARHLFKLFEIRLPTIEPRLGIEMFMLEAPKVEDHTPVQEKLWDSTCGLDHMGLAELLDRLSGKIGHNAIHRYLQDEHYWPERSFKKAGSLVDEPQTAWKNNRPRPLQLLPKPEAVEVTAPIPDYPPMLFRYKGKLHKIIKADGPERIEQEWWLQDGQHRDYYAVEDEQGYRYWLFRSGHYTEAKSYQWFIHGFFA